jgi:pectate lyase
MKQKLILAIFIITIAWTLVACQNDNKEDIETFLNQASETIILPLETEINLNLIQSLEVLGQQIEVSWSSNSTWITTMGIVTRPAHELGDQTVELIATLTKEGVSVTKTFLVVVRALPQELSFYTVSFMTYGGTLIENKQYQEGAIVLSPTPPTKEGFVFIGWYLEASFSTLYNFDQILTSSLTLHAKWEEVLIENTYNITFNTQGGLPLAAIASIPEGENIDTLPDPIRTGYRFLGWYLDALKTIPFVLGSTIQNDLMLYANWEAIEEITFTIDFDNVEPALTPITGISFGSVVSSLPEPVKSGYTFIGWYIDQTLLIPFNLQSEIESNLTLYAKWEANIVIPDGTPISTAQEFNQLSNSGLDGLYYIANDIDFANHTWTYSNHNFKGTINGNGKTLSNLTLHGTDRTGLFARVNNFTIFDLIIDNFNVTSTNRAGLLIGETDGTNVQIQNVKLMNSSVSGHSSNGVGALIGYTKPGNTVSINQILIENTTVTNQSSASGGLIGMTDGGHVFIADINLKGVTVRGQNRVGGLYGEIKGTVNIQIERAVLDVDLLTAQYLGGIVGRNQSTTGVSVKDVMLTGVMVSTNRDFGHISGDLSIQTSENIYAAGLSTTGSLNKQNLASSFLILDVELLNLDWWEDHLPTLSPDYGWVYLNHFYHLSTLGFSPKDSHPVTLILGLGQTEVILYVKENTTLTVPSNPSHPGFSFIGWYQDVSLTVPFDFDQTITEPQTLYAKWEALPTYTVSVNGILQIVSEGEFATEPDTPQILGKIFIGWYIGDVPFDFQTPITSNLTIIPLYQDATLYEITFNTGLGSQVAPLSFYENQQISQLPRPELEGYRFVNWFIDATLLTPLTQSYLNSDLTLYAKYAELGELIFEESFTYLEGTNLASTAWVETKPGQAIIENGLLKLTETATEAIYEQSLSVLADGRYVLVFDFKQGIGGASFTIELIHQNTRIFTVGANRANRFTYRNQDGSETAVPTSILSVIPNVIHQAIIVFDTTYDTYKYYVSVQDQLLEITPSGGVGFASSLDPNKIRIRVVGHNSSPSTEPITYLDNMLIESTSETLQGKSAFDPEEPIDYEVLIQTIYNELTIPFQNDVRSNLFLAQVMYHVPITWTSSNPAVITDQGIVSRDEQDDIHVSMTATISKGGITLTKEFEVLVKAISGTVDFSEDDYALAGFASGAVSIPNLKEGDPGYYVVYNAKDLMDAINAENSASKGTTAARIIEIRSNLDLGYDEVVSEFGVLKNLDRHALPKMHPILKQTGVSKIVIQDRDGSTAKYNEGLVIFSNSGHTIRHASFQIKRANNVVIRNLKFDELWEWDEATKGNYDSNDWDYFTIEQVNGIWFDHITLGKAYDGLIDFKAGSSTIQSVVNATISYMHLVFEPNSFIQAQFEYLEANRSSYSYYNQMRNAGMSMQEIMELNSFQKKGFLLGGSELRAGNVFTLSIYNSYFKNLQDRFPRLRGGNVHIFNTIYDASDVYRMRNYVRSAYTALFLKAEYNRQLTNQALVTTENGAILLENSIIMGVSQVIKSNQVSRDHPTMTGKYMVRDSLYILDDYIFFGSSEDEGTPFVRANSEPILPFSWNFFDVLPYSNYELVPVNVLESYLNQAILGATEQPFDWLSLTGKPIHP